MGHQWARIGQDIAKGSAVPDSATVSVRVGHSAGVRLNDELVRHGGGLCNTEGGGPERPPG